MINRTNEPVWGRKGDGYFFSANGGIADFKRYSSEYDDFELFFTKYKKAKPTQWMDESYLQKGYDLFKAFQAKKYASLAEKVALERSILPVKQYESQIVDAVKNNRVLLIAADTGAGKSTQVPQYLMQAGFDKIACTQPRRIACYSLAKRVSYESLNHYGSQIAYQVRFDGSKTEHTRVLFLTEGVLLRQFSKDPFLKDYNVIIIDEVHERHMTGDFLLGILKRLLTYRLDLKLVLMSATINSQLFSKYFDAPVIEIPGRMFPVKIEYYPVEEKDKNLINPKFIEERAKMAIKESIPSKGVKIKAGPYLKILERIDEQVPETERGDLLIFVSGMNEIALLGEELKLYANFTRRWIILELHSSLSVAEQEKVFDIAPEGVRKCIISTNIAETSVTIDGIRFIIDSGKVKEMGHDNVVGLSRLSEFWISQSSAKQRTGRAGRTGPGQCYRFYSKEEYECFNDFPVPEILRMPLDSIVLEIKSLGLGEPRQFDFLERPSDQSIAASLSRLSNLGCIDEREEITNLGRVLSSIPIDSVLGKMLVLGSISELLDPILAIAACLSIQSPFTRASDSDSKIVSKKKELFSTHGDPFTLMNLFVKWLEVKAEPKMSSRKWCKSHGVEEQRMYEIVKLKAQFEGILKSCTLHTNFTEKKTELDEEAKHERRKKKRDLVKMKLESRANSRKFLKLDEGEYAMEETEEQEFAKTEEEVTVEELEFSLHNNASDLLVQTDVSSLPHRQLTIIKLIICSGLYPNIAICDESNYFRPPADQVYHTKAKRFLSMIPNSVFAFNPEVLHGEVSSLATDESLDTLHDKRTQREVLSYVQLLETTKPYLMNVVRVGALPMALLFAKRVDITHDLLHLVVDEWLLIKFPSSEVATEALRLGNWLRYAWGVCIDRKLANFAQTSTFPEEAMFGTQFGAKQSASDISTVRPSKKLNTLRYLPCVLHDMREDWHRFAQTGDSVEGRIDDVDVMDRIVDLVDFEIDYHCQKLKMTSITELFGYDPYMDHIKDLCVKVTPNFNYYPSSLDLAERDSMTYQLPLVVKQESESFQPVEYDSPKDEALEIENDSVEVQRRAYDCPTCEKTLYFSLAEIIKHRKSCKQ